MIRQFEIIGCAFVGLVFAVTSGMSQEVKRTEISRSPLSGDDNREIIMYISEFPPGSSILRHFHNGEESFYVLEGGTTQIPGNEPREFQVGRQGINRRGVPHGGVIVVGNKTIKILSIFVVDKNKPLQESVP